MTQLQLRAKRCLPTQHSTAIGRGDLGANCWQFLVPTGRHFPVAFPCCTAAPRASLSRTQSWGPFFFCRGVFRKGGVEKRQKNEQKEISKGKKANRDRSAC